MKTAMQELIEWMTKNEFMVNMAFIDKVNECFEKEKEQIKILTNALERIKDWDDEMHSEWDDCGEFASFTLKTYNQNK